MSLPKRTKLLGWENFLRKWCEPRRVYLTITNGRQHWQLMRGRAMINWWPSTGKWENTDGSRGHASNPTKLVEACAADYFPSDSGPPFNEDTPVDEDRPEEAARATPQRPKPSCGVTPRHIRDEARAAELAGAIVRHEDADSATHREWVEELAELIQRLLSQSPTA